MKKLLPLLTLISLLLIPSGPPALARPAAAPVQQPVLKWSQGGCFDNFCTEALNSSPAVADLNRDGKMEVIAASYRIIALDGATGNLLWRIPTGYDRRQPDARYLGGTWADVVVADLDGNGDLEIVTAHGAGWLSVYNHEGYFEPGWPKQVTPGYELRSLGVYDLDGDGILEIMIASTRDDNQWYVFEPNGALRPSHWPQHDPDSETNGFASGAYNQNIAAGDLDRDGRAEILGPSDIYTVSAFEDDGSQIRAASIFGTNPDGQNRFWSQIGIHPDQAADTRAWTNCSTERRAGFNISAPFIADVNNDGTLEAIVTGTVDICGVPQPYPSLYETVFIFNGDHTRWKSGSFDWTQAPMPEPNAAPLTEDYHVTEQNHPNPTVADLDGDGLMEILYPSYDGRLHAWWLDKSEHGNWPFPITQPGEGIIRFGSEALVADLNADGQSEVISTSWPQKGSRKTGKLHILNAQGSPLWELPLPNAYGGEDWNGATAAPTLANIDGDPDLELVINTVHSGIIAYDLPGTANARVQWGTGRASYQRSGSFINGSLAGSSITTDRQLPKTGETINFTVTLRNNGAVLKNVSLSAAVPDGLSLSGTPTATTGQVTYNDGNIRWSGNVPTGVPVAVQYGLRINNNVNSPRPITSTVVLNTEQGTVFQLRNTLIANGLPAFLPNILRP